MNSNNIAGKAATSFPIASAAFNNSGKSHQPCVQAKANFLEMIPIVQLIKVLATATETQRDRSHGSHPGRTHHFLNIETKKMRIFTIKQLNKNQRSIINALIRPMIYRIQPTSGIQQSSTKQQFGSGETPVTPWRLMRMGRLELPRHCCH